MSYNAAIVVLVLVVIAGIVVGLIATAGAPQLEIENPERHLRPIGNVDVLPDDQ